MKKVLVGTSLILLTAVATIAEAQDQQQQGVSQLQRQLQQLGETVKTTNPVYSDIQAPVSPAARPTPQAPSTLPSPPQTPGVPFTPGGTAQPPTVAEIAANLNAARTGVVSSNQTPNAPAAPGQVVAAPPLPPIREQAFEDMMRTQLPMTPDQIRTLKLMFDAAQKAAAEHPGTPPKPTSSSQIVDLSPGATPPIIRLQGGFVTSIVFLDATGTPWPIKAYDIGDPRSFNVQWDQKGNTLMLQAISGYKTGNLAVILRDLNTPIMLTLLPGQKAVDYRVDLRMPGIGPNAVTTTTHLPGKETPILLDVLNGVPPQGSTTLKISGCSHCRAWLHNGEIFFRTTLTVLSPGWMATLTSADGMHAYQLPSTPVVLVSDKGKMSTLTVEGF